MKHFITALAAIFCLAAPATAQDEEAIHQDIRDMRDAAIAAFLADDVYFTAMNNEVVHGKEAALAYYDRMLEGPAALIDNVTVTFESDVLSALYANGTQAVATGFSDSSFDMAGGLSFEMPLRWTAVLSNDTGDWQITGMHFSANIFENPLDTGLRKYLWLIVGGSALVGLILGVLVGRRRRA